MADEREAEDDASRRLDDPPVEPRVRRRRHLPQPLRDSSGNTQTFHPRRLLNEGARTQRVVSRFCGRLF